MKCKLSKIATTAIAAATILTACGGPNLANTATKCGTDGTPPPGIAIADKGNTIVFNGAGKSDITDPVQYCANQARKVQAHNRNMSIEIIELACLTQDKWATWERTKATDDELACIFAELNMPVRILAKMDGTPTDGMQQDEWDKITVEWTYHPDDGLNGTIYK